MLTKLSYSLITNYKLCSKSGQSPSTKMYNFAITLRHKVFLSAIHLMKSKNVSREMKSQMKGKFKWKMTSINNIDSNGSLSKNVIPTPKVLVEGLCTCYRITIHLKLLFTLILP